MKKRALILYGWGFFLFISPITGSEPLQNFDNPKISIITSVFKGEQFIAGFLADIVQQTIFEQCELIIINANSPENEDPIIRSYVQMYPNIIYERLEYDPGIYGVWNYAIRKARGEYITNANIDDRLAFNCYQLHLAALQSRPDIDLVYSDCLITNVINETFYTTSATAVLFRPEFSKQELKGNCLPNNHPMWRKSMHTKNGYFDEWFKISGDWEMWLRAVKGGSVFLKVPFILSLYYDNPHGLSSNPNGNWREEFLKVYYMYQDM